MCKAAREIKAGCRVRSNARSPEVTGSVSKNWKAAKMSNAPPATAKLQRQAISANPSEGTRKIARKPSKVGEGCFILADRKSTRLNSSHLVISYAVFCLKKKKRTCPWSCTDIVLTDGI